MNYEKLVKEVLDAHNGIAKRSTLAANGIPSDKVYAMYVSGFLQRVSQGYYKIAENVDFPEEQIIAATVPEAVISMESALFHYGYSQTAPSAWSITVPRTASRKLNTSVPLKIYYVKNDIYGIGKTEIIQGNASYFIYDRERTICDLFKHRGKMSPEMFSKAVTTYATDPQKDLDKLSEYAQKLRVYKKVTELMEVLLNS